MNTPTHRPASRDEQLERLAHQALRDQPLQRAPATLESKVMAEIARRAAAPWWQSSFAHWPMAARLVFLVMSVGFVKLGLEAASLVIGPLDPSARSAALFAEISWIHALFSSVGAVFRGLPVLWVYGGIAVLAGLYLMLFGVSAAAYRTLYASR
jgi:membrane-bound ClpP family serine protease